MIRGLRLRDVPRRSQQSQRRCVTTPQQRLSSRVGHRGVTTIEKESPHRDIHRLLPDNNTQTAPGLYPVRPHL